jgi:polysaccharide transporter, PST family
MFKKIRNFVNSEDKKRLLSNFFSLSILQGFNYLLPLITLPYLVRILGAEYFGLLAFSSATIGYFLIITDYGFNLSATKEISINRGNIEKLIEIFSAVFTLKILLMLLSAMILTLIVFTLKKFSQNWQIYFYSFGLVFGQILFPVWFFQGMERMNLITIFSILAKSFFTIAIFIFIKSPSDFYKVPILTSIGYIVVGILSLIIIKKSFRIEFRIQSFRTLYIYLRDGWHIFISNLATSLYTMSTILLLGIFTNNVIVGYYSAAEKLIGAIKMLISPVSQTLFPYFSRKSIHSKDLTLLNLRRLIYFAAGSMFIISACLFVFSKFIIITIYGKEFSNSIIIFQLLSIIPCLVAIDTIAGTLTMLVFERGKQYSRIILSAGFLNIMLAIILIPFFHHIGAAVSVLSVEFFITISMLVYVQKNDLKIFGAKNG